MPVEKWFVLVDGHEYGPFTESVARIFALECNGLVYMRPVAALKKVS